MALMHELSGAEPTGDLTEASMGSPWGEVIRDYQPAADTRWRWGKPNYERVNKAYFAGREKKHKAGSLDAVVSKLVKNWEVETHHISDPTEWKTVVPGFEIAQNSSLAVSSRVLADIGPYNYMLGEKPEYSAACQTCDSANTIFSNTFPDGFAWEVLEVLSGPPTVTFKWRHFGAYSGEYVDRSGKKHVGNGETINFIGMCIAKVDDALVFEKLEIYYNPDDLLMPLTKTKCVEEK